MRRLYEPVNKPRRADQHRKDAEECHNAGFPNLARLNWEQAEFLDPPRRDDEEYQD